MLQMRQTTVAEICVDLHTKVKSFACRKVHVSIILLIVVVIICVNPGLKLEFLID